MKVILYGCAVQAIKIIHRMKRSGIKIELKGFLDSDKSKWGKEFYGYPVLGGMEVIKKLVKKNVYYCNCVTRNTQQRKEITQIMKSKGAKFTNIIDPEIDLELVEYGKGLYIQEQVGLQAGSKIRDNVSIHMASLISHDVIIEKDAMITFGCHIAGGVKIGEGSTVYTGASIIPNVKIGKWSIIGAGSVVLKDVPDYTVVAGNPAKTIKQLKE